MRSSSLQDYPARRAGDEDVTFWIDSKIMERARRMAARDGVKLARLIDAALSAYVRQHIPEELINFRHRVHSEALKLYAACTAQRRRSPGCARAAPEAAARAARASMSAPWRTQGGRAGVTRPASTAWRQCSQSCPSARG